MMKQEIICAGFGGQGVMSMGQLLTYAGMLEEKHVSWLPSYGPEMRGGTANCSVIVSETPIGSPIVTEGTSAIVMNLPSLIKYEKHLAKDGLLLINSSLIDQKTSREDVKVYYIPANEIANELGNGKAANMVMLGAFLEITKVVSIDSILAAFKKVFGPSKEKHIPMNKEALEKGAAAVRG
ncbi:2-oxoacid:acceptor oxidoreductase family protein [Marinisporobacter balticus]|uniref:2-oxoglutarate ferredoxin oxidoreductase subunit gamma n=1 Tax=Marinisporobacter balticus TaxID=2018667 RepID=A0A4R2KFG4_9FIRM|nr:2-oxoacid:acceptor oxidoreductase family protein [Marinisporobacter balticus]TCO71804.1 2-oxoglutarate ferredoxin oxidoreductase subunit gamma [Marinisporobacter balticus]